jgi:hypothetical protein
MSSDDVIQGMRRRVEQCRRLAEMISHPGARETLLQMAREGEEDIKRLEAERDGSVQQSGPPHLAE